MYKVITVIFTLILCCYCVNDSELLVEDARAKKKKTSVRFWVMIALFVLSKVAVFKVVSVMLFMAVFQKLLSLGGLALGFFMKQKISKPPAHTYGPPSEYNTVGYSYGPPESENVFAGHDYGVPGLTELGGSFNNWLHNKNAK